MLQLVKNFFVRMISLRVRHLEDQVADQYKEIRRLENERSNLLRTAREQTATIEELEAHRGKLRWDYAKLDDQYRELLRYAQNEPSYQHLYEVLKQDYDSLESLYLAEGAIAIDHLNERIKRLRRFLKTVTTTEYRGSNFGSSWYSVRNFRIRQEAYCLLSEEHHYPPREK